MRKLFLVGGALILVVVLILVAGYFYAPTLVRKKMDETLEKLPSSMKVTYGSLRPDIFGRSLVMDSVQILDSGRRLSIGRLTVRGIDYLTLARSRRHVSIGRLELAGVKAEETKRFFLDGDVEIDSVGIADLDKPGDSVAIGGVRLHADKLSYVIPAAHGSVRVRNLQLDSKRSSLHADTVRIVPTLGKEELGRIEGHQVDWVSAVSEDLSVKGLNVPDLLQHRLSAGEIIIGRYNIHVFRDRRLPLERHSKPLPVDYLRSLPVSIRVQLVKFGPGTFTYEEFPGKGDKPGMLKVVRLRGSMRPLINRPMAGDPAYISLITEGSLMGSGSVRATTKMPLEKGAPYKVEGAFHELDVTTLNASAENLGNVHLESGMLNSLVFEFGMTEEKATGKIVGEYHNLVVDKLRGTHEKKVDRFKSFFLKKLIIPRDKDRTLPESKRTGKVDYKRDPERYFSFYLLHALLVGIKSSFSLGFLLPG